MVTDGLFRARIFLPVLAWLMKRVFCIELCGFDALARDFAEFLTIASRAEVVAKFFAR